MQLSAIGQIALPVSDLDQAEAFYGTALGLKRLFRYGNLLFFDCAGVRLMLEAASTSIGPSSGACHSFRVHDIEDARAQLIKKSVTFIDEPHLVAKMPDHELWMTFFRDPDGHLLALMEERR
jgi:methylmalonyl-CoA/ethylmalonyl-CoA epimerase